MSKEIENARELVEREVIATQTKNTIVLEDGSNKASIPGYPYAFLAHWDKVLVSVDIFKSGYECRECKGVGRIKSHCSCEDTDRPGYKYTKSQLAEFSSAFGSEVSAGRAEIVCSNCAGFYHNHRIDITCPECKGKKSLLEIPDTSKVLPTTGVIVSRGEDVRSCFKLGDRVLFGAYTGIMIPTKAPGICFKVLRDIELLCTIEGGEDMAAFDFVLPEKVL